MSSRHPVLPPAPRDVLLALLPGALVLSYWAGARVPLTFVLALGSCISFEALALRWRREPAGPAMLDGSLAVTAALLAFSLPSHGPWWLVPAASAAAIASRHAAAPGRPLFNPAMLGVAFVLLAFPLQLSLGWFDALSSATPLDRMRSGLQAQLTVREIAAAGGYASQAAMSQALALALLAGGAFLLWRRRIPWQIPAAVLAGLLAPALVAWMLDPDRQPSPLFHAWAGASMLVAFFIATDPATAPGSPRARLAYGAGIGVLAWLLRGRGYPEGFAFAVLAVNACTPALARGAAAQALLRRNAAALLILLAAAGLGLLQDRLAQRSARADGLAGVLPPGLYDNDPLSEARETPLGTRYLARRAGRPVAAIYRTQPQGYGGAIELLVAVLPDGRLAGLRVLAHSETMAFAAPYVGADRSWLEPASAHAWSGASVTPRAIQAALQRVLEYHATHAAAP